MPNTVPAADEGLPNLSRRSGLTKLGLGLAATTSFAATAIAAAPAGVAREFSRLIGAHRVAIICWALAALAGALANPGGRLSAAAERLRRRKEGQVCNYLTLKFS